MQSQAGIVSGYHEKREYGWERNSRVWDGKKWVLSEEYDTNGPDESINPDTGYEYGGTDFVKGFKRAQEVTRNVLSTVKENTIDRIIPQEVQDTPGDLAGGLLHQGANVYNLLPENAKGNIEGTAISLFETLEKANLGYAQRFNLHPDITSTALNLGEMAISGGLPSLAKKQFGKQFLKKAFTATKLTSLDNLGFSTVNAFDNNLLSDAAKVVKKGDGTILTFSKKQDAIEYYKKNPPFGGEDYSIKNSRSTNNPNWTPKRKSNLQEQAARRADRLREIDSFNIPEINEKGARKIAAIKAKNMDAHHIVPTHISKELKKHLSDSEWAELVARDAANHIYHGNHPYNLVATVNSRRLPSHTAGRTSGVYHRLGTEELLGYHTLERKIESVADYYQYRDLMSIQMKNKRQATKFLQSLGTNLID